MKYALVFASLGGAAGWIGLKKIRSAKTAPADKMRNDQGVGSTHIPGVPRGEEQMDKNGSYEVTSLAGRIAGSIHPESRGPGSPYGHESKSSWGRKRWVKWAGTSMPPDERPVPPVADPGPGGAASWTSSFSH